MKSVQIQSFFWPVFGMNTKITVSSPHSVQVHVQSKYDLYSVRIQSVFSPNTRKYEPEKALYLNTLQAIGAFLCKLGNF